ncbi:ADP-forming succinate--CoA ligase subunit beta [Wolbachia endosymbiont of Howardula sp.]|uniref:ADP-forming succinate--CoA ligase subunit beta n=1 Tax=Wolbachia endosymbiont of Howardula sp. TaxID=2916816 RepID=UPI00217D77D9|nr:ADP-forming succinate--CoA ligase subunit beta [Wolbachia endosymbiont of Howardula sp.]UWI83035.1 ADP-forming succinate--CoA ligase subunit beta [Wolbachia endosymbiont of Howardula sp.]
MNIHEYQAKEILRQFNIPIPKGFITSSLSNIDKIINQLNTEQVVIKAQVYTGGRGKGGGIILANSRKEIQKCVQAMLGMTLFTNQTGLHGKKVRLVYIEEAINITREFYISLLVDVTLSRLLFVFSSEGGMDIEQTAIHCPNKIMKFSIDPAIGFKNFNNNQLMQDFDLNKFQIEKLTSVAKNIYKAFIANDASQIEINPLVETHSGDFIALDAKMTFDDNALYRHPELNSLRDSEEELQEEREAIQYGLSYIKMNGNIGCMVNGAGLAMATMDIIQYYGGAPANFLDVGGSADQNKVIQAFKIILSDRNVKGILVNIFGGIMHCDVIASGLVIAVQEICLDIPIVVRLSGTHYDKGRKILLESSLKIFIIDELAHAAQKIVSEVYHSCLS